MNKFNLLPKKIKQRFFLINNSIENYFNKLKILKSNLKKGEIIRNNKVFFSISAVVILTLGYFLLPTIYNKNEIEDRIKYQISKKYNIDIKFNEKIRYGLLPKPHFTVKNLSILNQKKEIGIAKNFSAYIKINNFFLVDKFEIKNLVFKKVDFNITKNDTEFFVGLMKTEPNENEIIFKKSNIFFKDKDDEVLFINKINNSRFYYDSYNLENVLVSKNEIFKIPYKLEIRNNKFNKKLTTELDSKKIRLNIENEIDYSDKIKKGLLDVLFINKDTTINYEIKKNSLAFNSQDRNNNYNGIIDFRPFYFTANFNYDGLSSRNILTENSIIFDLIRSGILNNPNLNLNINLKIKDIINIAELNDLTLILNVEEGNIISSESSILWKDDLKIILKNSLLNYHQNEVNLSGRILINFKNISDFYKSFQVKKNNRKEIQNIQFDFNYNLSQKKLNFDNVKIDNKSNENLNTFINNFNEKKGNIFNKITFKNFVNDFFSSHSG